MYTYTPHNKLLVIVFSILLPGAGHYYVGSRVKAFSLLPLLLFLQYISLYLYTIYVTPMLFLLTVFILITIYVYGIYNPIQIINKQQDKYRKYNHWLITLFIFIPLFYLLFISLKSYIPLRTFYIPTKNMETTILRGDYIVAKKSLQLSRGELSIFEYPKNPSIFYCKRCVAIGGDELLYEDKKLMIHFNEGDEYIKKNYPRNKIIKLYNKLWVINPYMSQYSGIQYKPKDHTVFEYMSTAYNYNEDIDMSLRNYTSLRGSKKNIFYKKVEKGHYYMIGDNRDQSNDSRFWGSINKNSIYGKPNVIYFHLNDNWILNWNRIGTKLN